MGDANDILRVRNAYDKFKAELSLINGSDRVQDAINGLIDGCSETYAREIRPVEREVQQEDRPGWEAERRADRAAYFQRAL